jgi:hypothetical protein
VLTPAALNGRGNPCEILREQISKEEASAGVVAACLKGYFEMVEKMSFRERKSTIESWPISAICVDYLWRNPKEWVPFFGHPGSVQDPRCLCYFAVRERLDGLLLEWIRRKLPKGTAVLLEPERREAWRDRLLRAIISAKCVRADALRKADAALELFFSIWGEKDQAAEDYKRRIAQQQRVEPPPVMSVRMLPAATQRVHTLGSGDYSKTDPHLYDMFVLALQWFERNEPNVHPEDTDLDLAFLGLRHPGFPSTKPALQFIEKHLESKDVSEIRAQLPSDARFLMRLLILTNDLAKTQGQVEDARRVQNLFYGIFPSAKRPPNERIRKHGFGQSSPAVA